MGRSGRLGVCGLTGSISVKGTLIDKNAFQKNLARCKLLEAEERDPQQWYKCESTRLRDASSSIKAMLNSPYFDYMNTPKTAEIYWTLRLVDPPIEGESNSRPKANFQKIAACQRQNSQELFSGIRFTEIKAALMDDPTVSSRVKHRIHWQVASQQGSGTASMVVPTEKCLEMDDDAALQAVCCRLGLPIQGLHMRARCLSNCTQTLNGTACHTDRQHGEREHNDWHTLPWLCVASAVAPTTGTTK